MASTNHQDSILISVYPAYGEQIKNRQKQVEFRKTRITRKIEIVYFYFTSPISKVLLSATIKVIDYATPHHLWSKYKHISGITKQEFDEYFRDNHVGTAIVLHKVFTLDKPRSIYQFCHLKHPPQNFIYIHSRA